VRRSFSCKLLGTEVEAAKAAFLPSFTITAGAGFQAFDPAFLFLTPASIAYNALGGLVAPLFNWNALEAQQRNATAEQVRALTQYQQKIVNAYMEVANELFHINNLRELDSLKLQQRNVLQESVDIATELYKSAKATYLEILLAQQSSLQAQLELMQIKKRRQIALVNLYKALGGGWR
jgi:outer membrane protein TolC